MPNVFKYDCCQTNNSITILMLLMLLRMLLRMLQSLVQSFLVLVRPSFPKRYGQSFLSLSFGTVPALAFGTVLALLYCRKIVSRDEYH